MEKIKQFSFLTQLLVLAGVIFGTGLVSRLMLEIDYRFGSRQWLYFTLTSTLLGMISAQMIIWKYFNKPLMIKILISFVTITIAIGVLAAVLALGTQMGWRGVPAERG
jgi:hypothetical protein